MKINTKIALLCCVFDTKINQTTVLCCCFLCVGNHAGFLISKGRYVPSVLCVVLECMAWTNTIFLRGEMHVWGGFSASLVTVTMKQPSYD